MFCLRPHLVTFILSFFLFSLLNESFHFWKSNLLLVLSIRFLATFQPLFSSLNETNREQAVIFGSSTSQGGVAFLSLVMRRKYWEKSFGVDWFLLLVSSLTFYPKFQFNFIFPYLCGLVSWLFFGYLNFIFS